MSKMPSIILIWLLVLGLAACQHDPGPNSQQCGEATTIDEMMEWIYFKTGTYWVYEEQNTGELDTMTVVTHGAGIHTGTNYRWFSYEAVSSRDGYTYYWWFSDSYTIPSPGNDLCRGYKIYCSKSKPGDFYGEDVMLMFPLYPGNWIGISGGGDGGISFVDSVNVPMLVSYSNTTILTSIWHIDNSVCDSWTEVNYSLSKNYGIVRKHLTELNELWILSDMTIIQ